MARSLAGLRASREEKARLKAQGINPNKQLATRAKRLDLRCANPARMEAPSLPSTTASSSPSKSKNASFKSRPTEIAKSKGRAKVTSKDKVLCKVKPKATTGSSEAEDVPAVETVTTDVMAAKKVRIADIVKTKTKNTGKANSGNQGLGVAK
ncbi:hypothetical protein N0V85_000823 [Neurospora sp. IMI 360204]|nr:hypothetical protein N0V85_000823 [Neurospora sp. IMI 360204]